MWSSTLWAASGPTVPNCARSSAASRIVDGSGDWPFMRTSWQPGPTGGRGHPPQARSGPDADRHRAADQIPVGGDGATLDAQARVGQQRRVADIVEIAPPGVRVEQRRV